MAGAVEAKINGVEVDTSGLSRPDFEIFLKSLAHGPRTVSVRELQTGADCEDTVEELAPSPFAKAKPMIY